MKILNATSSTLLSVFWKTNPRTTHGTLLDYISNSKNGWIGNGCEYAISKIMGLNEEPRHYAEYFSLTHMYQGKINLEGDLAIHDYIDCSTREFVSKIFHKVGGVLEPTEVKANQEGPMWLSRFMATPSSYLVIEGDCDAVTIRIEPFSS